MHDERKFLACSMPLLVRSRFNSEAVDELGVKDTRTLTAVGLPPKDKLASHVIRIVRLRGFSFQLF